jgi:hypothetical protein
LLKECRENHIIGRVTTEIPMNKKIIGIYSERIYAVTIHNKMAITHNGCASDRINACLIC